ncbi:type IV pilin protein [Endozoicomonas arenosclerae]|uniref:type IV pilin protein n=1 Tax=Endozoicomonas arenosclerae TaxID=1633495 RepID=UPI0007828707|nr:type IV pilin protein [Endozoicomonas arenosclerae]
MKIKINNAEGFTLIEMMIVIAIIGVLAAVAIPSYNQHVQDTAATDARASLIGLANAMERHRAQNGSYLGAADGGANNGAPTVYHRQSPETGQANFNLTITVPAGGATYTLTATATGGSGITAGDTITLTSIGQRAGTGTLANAWN